MIQLWSIIDSMQKEDVHRNLQEVFFFNIAGKKFPGFHPTKLVSRDYAEIDDISVIRDGDHLFLLQM